MGKEFITYIGEQKCEFQHPGKQGGHSNLPAIPMLRRRGYEFPQSKLAGETRCISQLQIQVRAPVSVVDHEESDYGGFSGTALGHHLYTYSCASTRTYTHTTHTYTKINKCN